MNRNRILFILLFSLAMNMGYSDEVIVEKTFSDANDLQDIGIVGSVVIAEQEDGSKVLEVAVDNPEHQSGINIKLPVKQIAGKRVVFTCEISKQLTPPTQKWQGGKFCFSGQSSQGSLWDGAMVGTGTAGWSTASFSVDVPVSVEWATVYMGTQKCSGKIWFRNLKIVTGDTLISFQDSANMSLVDEIAGDGKGGWSDQGPDNDAGEFEYKRAEFGGVPFNIVSDKAKLSPSILAFKGSRLMTGLESATIDLKNAAPAGRYLYLLHTATGGNANGSQIGTVRITSTGELQEEIPIVYGADVVNWWMPKREDNAYPVYMWSNSAGGTVGVYLSKFKIDPSIGNIESITFTANNNNSSVWLVLAANISEKDYPFQENDVYKIVADGVKWKESAGILPVNIIKGSALDLSWLNNGGEPGRLPEVMINKDGKLAFGTMPSSPCRFSSNNQMIMFMAEDISDKEKISRYAEQMQRAGYNMIRFHYLPEGLINKSKKAFVFEPELYDHFHYLVYELEKRGMYMCLDAMCGKYGYGVKEGQKPDTGYKFDIYFDPEVRENWHKGVNQLLHDINPYTKKSLAEDSVVALVIGFNEQEFSFSGRKDYNKALPQWKAFLKERYGSLVALEKAWQLPEGSIESFDAITAFTQVEKDSTGPKGTDIARFLTKIDRELYEWYRTELRKAGYKGPVANYNMSNALRHAIVRADSDYIALNSYHAHPSAFSAAGIVDSESSIYSEARIVRQFSSVKQAGKPLAVTEHGHGFWNPYRYEHGFIMSGYSSFQDFSVLTSHGDAMSLQEKQSPIKTFGIKTDPVVRATEWLTNLIFRRGDIKPSEKELTLVVNPEAVYNNASFQDTLNPDQTRLSLITGVHLKVSDTPLNQLDPKTEIQALGGSPILYNPIGVAGYAITQDTSGTVFKLADEIVHLKEYGYLSKDNRTSPSEKVYESSTKEIFMNCPQRFMSINTARTQGLCGVAGATAKLDDVEIESMSVNGCLVASSIDGMLPLKTAKRIVVAYITNAMNSGMVFEDASLRHCIIYGTLPLIIETGSFQATLSNAHSSAMHCYALSISGERVGEIPLEINGQTITIKVDTAKIPNAPTFFFELTALES